MRCVSEIIRSFSIFRTIYFFLILLLLSSCSTSSLDQNEKRLVGNWLKPINDEQVQGAYMELKEDRTGVWGPAIKVDGEVGLSPYISMLIKDWQLKNDTLSMQMELRPGLVFRGPDRKEWKGSSKPSYFRYNVREVSDSVIVIEEVMGGELGIQRMRRSEKLELLND